MRAISIDERRRRLGRRHYLAEPAATVEAVAAGLIGLHSSDPASVFLSAWARIDGLQMADVDRTLYEDRTLLRLLGMRRTLFVVPADVAGIMDAACTKGYVPAERRRLVGFLEDQLVEGDGDAWLEGVLERTMKALHDRGEATAKELVADVPELGSKLVFSQGTFGLSTRVLFLLATAGRIVRARPLGSFKSSQYRWTPLERWVPGGFPKTEPGEGRRQLTALWLQAFGPGTLTDLRWWTGWTVKDTREALDAVGAVQVELASGVGFLLPDDDKEEADVGEWVAFLPGLDPTVMGWKERGWYLGDYEKGLFDTNGNAGPTVWWNGKVVGGWGQRPEGEVVFQLLEAVPAGVVAQIETEARRLTDWLGGVAVKPRFPTALERRLRS